MAIKEREVDDFIRAGEVARMLHVSPKTVARWSADGSLPYVRTLGGHRRFRKSQIQAIIDKLDRSNGDGNGT